MLQISAILTGLLESGNFFKQVFLLLKQCPFIILYSSLKKNQIDLPNL